MTNNKADRCIHCNIRKKKRRGLCHACHGQIEIREMYPPIVNTCSGHRYEQADFFGVGDTPEPTNVMPGSEAKIQLLMERVTARQELFHPRDNPGDDE